MELDHIKSQKLIKIVNTATEIRTIIVELINSRRVGHETFFSSNFTSVINFAALFIGSLSLKPQERQESNLQSRLWRPLVCQLTDAPKPNF